jgi:CMP-N,N'-diacetyllegionaminic acid synthase
MVDIRMLVRALIPARSGSKGIHNKNLANGPLCGSKTLIQWTLDAAMESKFITHLCLSSDDQATVDLLPTKTDNGTSFYPDLRPSELCGDDTSTEAVVEHVLDKYLWHKNPGIFVILQLTSPLRSAQHIDAAIEQMVREKADSLVSVVPSHRFLWYLHTGQEGLDEANDFVTSNYDYTKRKMKQDVKNSFMENGAIYAFTFNHWVERKCRLGGRISLFNMEEETGLEIDSPLDLMLVDKIMREKEEASSD